MNIGTRVSSECAASGGGFTLADLASCCLPIALLAASIVSLL